MNCKVIVEYDSKANGDKYSVFDNNVISHNEYEFDDYRVAIAIANILDNTNFVIKKCWNIQKENTNND